MFFTCNGLSATYGTIRVPRIGPWHADLIIDTIDPAELGSAGSRATIVVGEAQQLNLVGTFMRLGPAQSGVFARIVGGANGLGRTMAPKSYNNPSARVVVGEVVEACGEQLSGTSTSSVLATTLVSWARFQQAGGSALAQLAHVLSAGWRVLYDGTVWFGTESWPQSALSDYTVIRYDPELARIELGADYPIILPGTTFTDRQVDNVNHTITDGRVRTVVHFVS